MLDALLLLAAAGATSAWLAGGGPKKRRWGRTEAIANERIAGERSSGSYANESAEVLTGAGTATSRRARELLPASLAHELRTPLNSIIGFSELLLAGVTGDLNAEQRRQLEMILSSGEQLLETIGRSSLQTTGEEPDAQARRRRAGRRRFRG